MENLYNQVSIGDILVISYGDVKKTPFNFDTEPLSLNPEKFFNIELKVHMYDTRRIYRIENKSPPKLLDKIDCFPAKGTWRPVELFNE